MDARWVLGAGALLLLAAGALAWWTAHTPEAEPSAVRVPPLGPGTEATYVLEGPPRALRQPIFTDHLEEEKLTEATVRLETGQMPRSDGQLVPSRILTLATPEGSLVAATAATDGAGFATVRPSDHDTDFEPLTTVRMLPSTGPMDGFLFEGAVLEEGRLPLVDVVPRARVLDEGLAAREAGPATHVDVTLNDSEAGLHADVVVSGVEEGPRNETIDIRYRFTPDCPLPAIVRYPGLGEDPGFEAHRTSCQPGTDVDSAEADPVEQPETTRFYKRLPGEGANLPVAYRPALEAFLQQPDTQAFRQEEPGWRMVCASLHSDEDTDPWAWAWYFRIAGEEDVHGGWLGPLEEGGDRTFVRDPTSPASQPCGDRREPFTPAIPLAHVDAVQPALETVLDEDTYAQEAQLRHYTWAPSPDEMRVVFSRCQEESSGPGVGVCFEVAPALYIRLDGTIRQISAPPSWFAGDLPGLLD